MYQRRRTEVGSWLLAGALCLVAVETRADSKSKGAKGKTSPPASSKSCKAPTASTCAPGQGRLAPAVTSPYLEEGYIGSMAAADVNGDGKADLILGHTAPGYLEVLLGKGDGTFAAGTRVEELVNAYGLIAADFDGDCNVDLLASAFPINPRAGNENGRSSSDDSVSFLAGTGKGTFRPGTFTLLNQYNIARLLPADFNADGKLDFIYSGNLNDLNPTVALNQGKGKFTGAEEELTNTRAFAVGDVTGDGAAELVTLKPGWGGESHLCVRANDGKARFAEPVCYPLSLNLSVTSILIADVNGDGKKDLLGAGDHPSNSQQTLVDIFLNKGEGTFAPAAHSVVPAHLNAMSATDTDNDGRPDLVVYQTWPPSTLALLKNKGDGTFAAQAEQHGFGAKSPNSEELLVTGDFTGNGLLGFATVDRAKHVVSVIPATCGP